MAKRISISLPDAIGEALEQWAKDEGRPLAGLCASLLETTIRQSSYDPAKRKEQEGKSNG